MKLKLIAPCGMNCSLCKAYLRDKNTCPGCNGDNLSKPFHPNKCRIKYCELLLQSKSQFCFQCEKFPCTRIKNLDKRYRTKYGMSMIDNLHFIRDKGIRNFIKNEKQRWQKGNKVFCVHNKKYFELK